MRLFRLTLHRAGAKYPSYTDFTATIPVAIRHAGHVQRKNRGSVVWLREL